MACKAIFVSLILKKEKPEGGNVMKLLLIFSACLLLLLFACSPAVKPHDPVGVVKTEIEGNSQGSS